VKAEHQRPAGLLQPLEIPTWKWDDISMDFIVGLPRTQKGNDSIWVIVDRLTKVAHFLPVKTNYSVSRLAELYVDNILKLHGAPRSIVSDRGPQFTAQFWKSLHASMGTKLNYSTTFHPQTDGQTERVHQVLEDLLRACVLTYGSDWEKSLSYAEFSYNNGYQASLKMAPFEALYGRKCRTPLMWSEVGERTFFGPAASEDSSEQAEKLRRPETERCLVSGGGSRLLEGFTSPGYEEVPHQGKLSPRYVGPYPIVSRVGKVAYRLELPPELTGVHPVFHVSQLRKCVAVEKRVPAQALDVQETLEYLEYPVQILDWAEKSTRNTTTRFCKVLWSNPSEREATWEKESALREKYPHIFETEVTS
jgi:hypothetical protein